MNKATKKLAFVVVAAVLMALAPQFPVFSDVLVSIAHVLEGVDFSAEPAAEPETSGGFAGAPAFGPLSDEDAGL